MASSSPGFRQNQDEDVNFVSILTIKTIRACTINKLSKLPSIL